MSALRNALIGAAVGGVVLLFMKIVGIAMYTVVATITHGPAPAPPEAVATGLYVSAQLRSVDWPVIVVVSISFVLMRAWKGRRHGI